MTQGLVASMIGAVLIRIAITGEYLRYVQPWMRWPLMVTGAVLVMMATQQAVGLTRDADRVPKATWLLLLPPIVVFTIAPPALGAYVAERRAGQQPPAAISATDFRPTPGPDGSVATSVQQFVWGASGKGDLGSLHGQEFKLEGFVSSDKAGGWYVTQLIIYCCAADVGVQRVKVVGQPAPPRDQWVRVTGRWVEGTGSDGKAPPTLDAETLIRIATPKDPYS